MSTDCSARSAGAPDRDPYDVVVIGAGIVGAAIARRLSGYRLSVALLEAKDDVGDGTSKANTAILHTGFDAAPGTLESRLVARGYRLLSEYAGRTGIPVERTGAILVAWDEEQRDALPGLREKAEKNGYRSARLIDADEVYRELPHLGEGALAGLTVPDESIICTWTTNLALATDAVRRGTELLLRHRVTAVEPRGEVTVLRTDGGDVAGRWIVNAAGLGGDVVDRLFGFDRFTITPRRGELLVYDKQARPLADKIVLPVPTSRGKGVLISPTIYGNVMLGPTAEDLADRGDTGTSEQGLASLLEKGARLMPQLLREEVTATYAGLRAASEHSDYVIELDARARYIVAGGIRSTGLTAGMAIAEHVDGLLSEALSAGAGGAASEAPGAEAPGAGAGAPEAGSPGGDPGAAAPAGLALVPRDDLPPAPRMPNLGEAFPRPYQEAARIAADPAYGKIVCFCERVTAGEIRDALDSTIPPRTLEGIRRRTRAQNGRCQGFYCGAEVSGFLEAGTAGAGPGPAEPARAGGAR